MCGKGRGVNNDLYYTTRGYQYKTYFQQVLQVTVCTAGGFLLVCPAFYCMCLSKDLDRVSFTSPPSNFFSTLSGACGIVRPERFTTFSRSTFYIRTRSFREILLLDLPLLVLVHLYKYTTVLLVANKRQ